MNKRILNLAIPNIISNLSVPLLSSVDTAIVGHLDEVYYLGAIAIGSMIFNFVYWGFGFLRMGTTGMSAQAYGKNDKKELSLIFYRSIFIALITGIVLIIFKFSIGEFSFNIINASTDVEKYASSYFNIRMYAAPATLCLYVFHGWFLGLQNAKIPLLLTVVVNLLNVFFNILFIYEFDMKSDGVALGTVISQYIGLIIAVIIYLKMFRSKVVKSSLSEILKLSALKKFLQTNFDIFIRTLLLIFTFSFFTAKSAEFNDNILAANTILIQLWTILAYGIDGFAFAAESLVGRFIGAGDKPKLKKVIQNLFLWSTSLGLFLSLIYYFFDKELIMLFTDKSEVIKICLAYFGWTIAAPFINSFGYIWDGIYIGATATKTMRNAMFICTLGIFLPIFYFTRQSLGNNALWLSLSVFMISRALVLALFSRKSIFERN